MNQEGSGKTQTGELKSAQQLTSASCFEGFIFYFYFYCFRASSVEVPRLGVESELQKLASTTATATPDPSRVCKLQHIARQGQILNPLSEARGRTHILQRQHWVLNPLGHDGNSRGFYFSLFWAVPAARGSSWARHWIPATPAAMPDP